MSLVHLCPTAIVTHQNLLPQHSFTATYTRNPQLCKEKGSCTPEAHCCASTGDASGWIHHTHYTNVASKDALLVPPRAAVRRQPPRVVPTRKQPKRMSVGALRAHNMS